MPLAPLTAVDRLSGNERFFENPENISWLTRLFQTATVGTKGETELRFRPQTTHYYCLLDDEYIRRFEQTNEQATTPRSRTAVTQIQIHPLH